MNKKPWQSKTLWINLILAASALFVPGVGAYVQSHMEVVAIVFSGINIVLRLVTKDAIQLVD